MKNYIVWSHYNLTNEETKFGISAVNTSETKQAYRDMWAISLASAKKFVAGDWEPLLFDGDIENRVEMFKLNWKRILDLYNKEPCNILYMDSDTMCVQPVDVFGKFAEFRMFNWTDPKSGAGFQNYYNAGVRYYPHGISEEIWKIGKDMAENWDTTIWDQEQRIFNAMFWSQTLPDHHQPAYNYLAIGFNPTDSQYIQRVTHFNWLPPDLAYIMHFHGSRDCRRTADIMKDLAEKLGITWYA